MKEYLHCATPKISTDTRISDAIRPTIRPFSWICGSSKNEPTIVRTVAAYVVLRGCPVDRAPWGAREGGWACVLGGHTSLVRRGCRPLSGTRAAKLGETHWSGHNPAAFAGLSRSADGIWHKTDRRACGNCMSARDVTTSNRISRHLDQKSTAPRNYTASHHCVPPDTQAPSMTRVPPFIFPPTVPTHCPVWPLVIEP